MNKIQFEEVKALVAETLPDDPETVTQIMDLLDTRIVPLVQAWAKSKGMHVYRSSITGHFISEEMAEADPEHSIRERL